MFPEMLDHHAPIKIVRIQHCRCPFVNMEIKELMGLQHRDRFLKCAHHTGLQVDWSLNRDSRKVVKTKLRQAEREYKFRRSLKVARMPVLNGR